MTCIAVFSNVGGIGKTTLVYHLGHMLADLGKRVLLVDCDPQATLTSLCLSEDRLEALWQGDADRRTTIARFNDDPLHVESLRPNLALVPGDPAFAAQEDELAIAWAEAEEEDLSETTRAGFLSLSIIWAARNDASDIVLLDLGPSLGAINRAIIGAADFLLTPLAPSLQSMTGLQALGPTLRDWRNQWQAIQAKKPDVFPRFILQPLGYVVTQTGMRLAHPVPSYARWLARIPGAYRQALWRGDGHPSGPASDPECLGVLHHQPGLMQLALDARKPMFDLRPADGAIGSHMDSVRRCREDYERLTAQILARISREQ
ncbi:MAG: ParA family protein [Nannocystis sp.]|uniref:ParA family protein n=1 Tax=Nannocystis sp. TaxID=1962667 RepID=UPI002422724D|nr:ParA family protein [Nannocystis sp.]MBK9752425.1 ParA family protein [Nannocystis sp.]